MDWQCGEWTECINGLQTRQCDFVKVPQHVSESECPSQDKPPINSQKCETKVQATTKPSETETSIPPQIITSKSAQPSANASESNKITGAVVGNIVKPSYAISIIVLLVIAIAGFFIYKRFKPTS